MCHTLYRALTRRRRDCWKAKYKKHRNTGSDVVKFSFEPEMLIKI